MPTISLSENTFVFNSFFSNPEFALSFYYISLCMQLIYIYHSCFAILSNDSTVIIDYYKDSVIEKMNSGIIHEELLKRPGKLYVLATHFHPDHFNKYILEWKNLRPDIDYIFSKDILKHKRAKADDAFYIKKGELYEDETISIRAFGSTDSGVSFYIRLQDKTFFHAGDLNNWHWNEESTPAEIKKAEGDYMAELRDIHQLVNQIDVVMFPIDPKLGKDYMKGATQFIEKIKTGIFLPMHFGLKYEEANAFRPLAEANGTHFLAIDHPGQKFDIS